MALFFGLGTIGAVMNEGNTMSRDDGPSRRASAADEADDQRPEPHTETDDQTPEEAGYGYGV
jgi:hypothetical protein